MRRIIFWMYPDLILYGYFGTDKNRLSPVKFERSCKKWEMKLIDPKDSSILEHKITFLICGDLKLKEETLGNFAQIQNFVYDEKDV